MQIIISIKPRSAGVLISPDRLYSVKFDATSNTDTTLQMQFISHLRSRITQITHHPGQVISIKRGYGSYVCELRTDHYEGEGQTEDILNITPLGDAATTYIEINNLEVMDSGRMPRPTVFWLGRNSIEKAPAIMMRVASNVQDVEVIMNVPGGSRGNLRLLGRLPDGAPERYYENCDVFCSTAVWPEPAGLTLLEAQMHGKPILALNRGGVSEYTVEGGRKLIDAQPGEEVAKLSEYLTTVKNADLTIMGMAAKANAIKFSYKAMGENYCRLYDQLTGSKIKIKTRKILMVNEYVSMSGAEVVVANIIKHLQESGHETRLVVAEDLRTIPHDMSSPIKNSFSSYLEQFNPDVVHFHNITSIGLDPIRLCLKKGIPCLLTLHDYYIVCRNRMYFRWDLNRECTASDWTNCENCKNNVIGLPHPVEIKAVLDSVPIVCISRYQEKIIRRFGYKNTVVIYNGIQV